jgi:hypothetical protein
MRYVGRSQAGPQLFTSLGITCTFSTRAGGTSGTANCRGEAFGTPVVRAKLSLMFNGLRIVAETPTQRRGASNRPHELQSTRHHQRRQFGIDLERNTLDAFLRFRAPARVLIVRVPVGKKSYSRTVHSLCIAVLQPWKRVPGARARTRRAMRTCRETPPDTLLFKLWKLLQARSYTGEPKH